MAFKDPIDEEADAAESKITNGHASKLAERMASAREESTEEVSTEADDEDDEDAVETPQSRKDKRANRTTARERAAAAEARAEAYKEALAISGRTREEEGRPAPADALAGIDDALRKNYRDTKQLHADFQRAVTAAGGKMSASEEAEWEERAMRLDVENKSLIVDRREAQRAPQRESERKIAELKAAHPDVFANPAALRYAQGEWNRRMARGEPDTKDAVDAAFSEAREIILGKRPKPDAIQRQRATAMGGGTRAPSRADAPVTISMPKGSPLYRLACAQHPELEPADACKRWAQKNGKRFVERTSARG